VRPRPAARSLLPAVLLLSACTPATAPAAESVSSPFADCSTLASPPETSASFSSSPPPGGGVGGKSDLPDLSLECFTGGATTALTGLRGPAVINIWGSWCAPCRDELPVMQELAEATAGRLHVIGVNSHDTRDAAASFGADVGLTMPTLYDRDQTLMHALGRTTLPLTVFLDPTGATYVYSGKALDKPALGGLVRTHTGVTVGS
jgi:cytochrome c biogenesis protein CcmG, thiol:disulfide interchange protein DsbE